MIETFDLVDFGKALDEICPETPVQLGLVMGEYCFLIPVTDKAGIFIRSSIDHTKISGGTGQDSIRIYPTVCQKIHTVVGDKWTYQLQGSSDVRWVDRRPGWQKRLQESLEKLSWMISDAGNCPICGKPKKIFKVAKEGANKGRWFAKCEKSHGGFVWLD